MYSAANFFAGEIEHVLSVRDGDVGKRRQHQRLISFAFSLVYGQVPPERQRSSSNSPPRDRPGGGGGDRGGGGAPFLRSGGGRGFQEMGTD